MLLKEPPTTKHLSRIYHELSKYGARAVGDESPWPYQFEGLEELVALGADMSRYDPRLFSILVEFFVFHWDTINPLRLRQFMSRQNSPQALLVMLEFAATASKNEELRFFAEYLFKGHTPVAPQLFLWICIPPAQLSCNARHLSPCRNFWRGDFLPVNAPSFMETHD